MPSYRYTRDIPPEELQPEETPEYTKKEKVANWWRYHWKWVAGGAVLALLLVFVLVEVLSQDEPDLKIGILTPYELPAALTDRLQEGFAALAEDTNGDGKIVVQIDTYTIVLSGEDDEDALPEDPYNQMAGITRLTAEMGLAETFIFLADEDMARLYQEYYGIFCYLDGETPPENAADIENMVLPWASFPALAGMDLTLETVDGDMVDGQEMMQRFLVGRRVFAGKVEKKAGARQAWESAGAMLAEWRTG